MNTSAPEKRYHLFTMIRLFIAAILCSAFYVHPGSGDFIPWTASQKLSWSDFQATPPPGATNAALTSSSILMRFITNGVTLEYHITCQFDKQSSWGRVKNDHILSHEQGHFDIAEIYARKLNKALKSYQINKTQASRDVNAIYQSVMQELSKTQAQYDQETDFSRNVPGQKTWLVKIDNYLEEYKGYSDYR